MTTLVIDTCLAACQVAVARDGQVIAERSEPMLRGHQERLASMAAEAMADAGLAFSGLTRIAVTIGPGSFTGLRIGLAFAKGLRLATGAGLVGIGTLEALAASAGGQGRAAGVIDARRGLVYLQAFEAGRPLMAPDVLPIASAAARLAELAPDGEIVAIGPGAALLEGFVDAAKVHVIAAADLATLARLAERTAPAANVRPLYLRAPDAKLMAT
ncbi:MAG: tRNA (adenosine(37)-N6)-threonylcarbamoyltransferase complex dimerization subunit type 1 TsaB [Caulobacterales bacterium]